jgi:3'(2'), 5'-bisphosphate nucleotidase
MEFLTVLTIMKSLSLEAGKAILEVYMKNVDVEFKGDHSPVTKADYCSDAIITAGLKGQFPHIPVLSEEAADDQVRLISDWCFIVDPLDGTKEFLKRNDEFTVNIALAYRHKIVAGVIYAPALAALYYAAKGYGAWYEKDGFKQSLKVSERTGTDLRLVLSRSHSSHEEEKLIRENDIRHIKRSGSSLKGCLVAQGEADAYYRFGPTMEWDTAAMQCIIEEAGGIMRWLDGGEIFYNREDSKNKAFLVINNSQNMLVL